MNLLALELVRLEKGKKIPPNKNDANAKCLSEKWCFFFRSRILSHPWIFGEDAAGVFNWVSQSSNHETKQPSTEAHVYGVYPS